MASDWSCLQTAGLPGPGTGTRCVMEAAPSKPCLVSTYALLKLAEHVLCGHAASLTDGPECKPARESVCAMSSQLRLDSFPRMLHPLRLPSKNGQLPCLQMALINMKIILHGGGS